ncbi:uncharacterized protein V1513DRAFT_429657 [Lipomyces chichibuensis]|uniref:uncharacterized protein n=1 Tax=Lipomyces chichibuensis TaxID=1546026 RepID=UPI0033441876
MPLQSRNIMILLSQSMRMPQNATYFCLKQRLRSSTTHTGEGHSKASIFDDQRNAERMRIQWSSPKDVKERESRAVFKGLLPQEDQGNICNPQSKSRTESELYPDELIGRSDKETSKQPLSTACLQSAIDTIKRQKNNDSSACQFSGTILALSPTRYLVTRHTYLVPSAADVDTSETQLKNGTRYRTPEPRWIYLRLLSLARSYLLKIRITLVWHGYIMTDIAK